MSTHKFNPIAIIKEKKRQEKSVVFVDSNEILKHKAPAKTFGPETLVVEIDYILHASKYNEYVNWLKITKDEKRAVCMKKLLQNVIAEDSVSNGLRAEIVLELTNQE